MGQICCRCGKSEAEEKIVDGFCLTCFAEEFPLLLSLPEREVLLTVCKLCGDLSYHGRWVEVASDPLLAITEFLDEFIHKIKKIRGTEKIQVSGLEALPLDAASKQTLTIVFEGTPKNEVPPYTQTVEVPVVISIGVCDRCAKYRRGYFESIIQIRADRRAINEAEQSHIAQFIAQKKEASLSGNRMAYISKVVDQLRGGVDLYVGSDDFAKSLAELLADQLAASIDESKKLKSMKDGKPIYRTTYCVRLPYFEIGDVVEYHNTIYQIEEINVGRVVLFNLLTHKSKTISRKESHPQNLTVIKKKEQLQKHIIMAIQQTTVSLMNTITYETVEIDRRYIFDDHKEGEEINLVELPEGFFECKIS